MLNEPYIHDALKAGDVIINYEDPMIYLLYPGFNTYCASCFADKRLEMNESGDLSWGRIKLWACGHCLKFRYCGRDCQRNDWRNFHSHECQIYAKHGHHPMLSVHLNEPNATDEERMAKATEVFLTRIALRCLIFATKRHKDINRTEEIYGQKRSIKDLMDDKDKCRADHSFMQLIDSIQDFFKKDLALETQFGKYHFSHVRKLLFKFRINSFSINDQIEWKTIGGGMYLKSSFFDHSCAPNAAIIFKGALMQIRAIKDIKEEEPIFVTYVNILKDKATRQQILRDNYYFECACTRCSSKEDDLEADIARQMRLLKELEETYEAHGKTDRHLEEYFETYNLFIQLISKINGRYQPAVLHHKVLYFFKTLKYAAQTGNQSVLFSHEELVEDLRIAFGEEHPLTLYFTFVAKKASGKDVATPEVSPTVSEW